MKCWDTADRRPAELKPAQRKLSNGEILDWRTHGRRLPPTSGRAKIRPPNSLPGLSRQPTRLADILDAVAPTESRMTSPVGRFTGGITTDRPHLVYQQRGGVDMPSVEVARRRSPSSR